MKISESGIDLIKEFEGFSKSVYLCPGGKWTIGYGHVINNDISTKITKVAAEKLLKRDIYSVEKYINKLVKVNLTQGQFDALCSLIYNWGWLGFAYSKGLKALNKGDYQAAENEFFSKSQGVVKIKGKFSAGLYRRRRAEREVWNADKNPEA